MDNQENNPLQAILVGGAPNAGKSLLTYHLSQKLREHQVPHYVLRANPDGEGDWYIRSSNPEIVRQLRTQAHRQWSDPFRQQVSKAIRNRRLPLIVDIGGCPREEDTGILLACTHSLLLLKDGEEKANQVWRSFTSRTGLTRFAELHSDRENPSVLTAPEPVITGRLGNLNHLVSPSCEVFEALVCRIEKLFGSFSEVDLERMHIGNAPADTYLIHLGRYLRRLAPAGQKDWTPSLRKRLIQEISPHDPLEPLEPLALYGRGPNWLYGTLALHSDLNKPFYQFDPRFEKGWITPLNFAVGNSSRTPQETITLKEDANDDAWMLTILLNYGYIDYESEAKDLIFPEPPDGKGVIINGKLPLWLYTSLARFYARYPNVPWIAFNYADDNRAFVISSKVADHATGERVPLPV